MSVTMSREEREQFLAGVHVGVISVACFRMSPERWLTVDYSKVYG